MGRYGTLQIILLLIGTIGTGHCGDKPDFIYTAVSPILIRSHSSYNLIVSVDQAISLVDFEIKILTENNNVTISKEKIQLPPKTSAVVQLKVNKLKDEFYNLTLEASSNNENGKTSRHIDHGLIYVDLKQSSIIIQTDKPIYKPGEIVQFRVMLVDRFLKPFINSEKPLEIEIYDSQRNIIKSWKGIELNKKYGFFKQSVLLSKEPNLGDWSIEVSKGNDENRQTHQFLVDQYVLPKFKVEVKPKPSFVTYNNSKFTLEISSIYTHGKPVKGQCTVILKPFYEYEIWSADESEQEMNSKKERKISKTIEIDGKQNIEFDFKTDLHIRYQDATEYGNDFKIEASCTEKVSGHVQNATATIKVYKYPYKITEAESPRNYKPGFPFSMLIKVSTQDDLPISDPNPDALKIHHGFSYNEEDSIISKPIPPTGLVSVTFSPPTNEFLFVNGLEVTYKELTQFVGVPSRQISPTKSYMQLTAMNKSPKAGESLPILVKVNKPFDVLHYVVIARGIIVKWERVSFPQPSTNQVLDVQLPPAAAPDANLIVYIVLSPKNDIVVENLKLSVQFYSQKKLQINLSQTTLEPGASVSINCEAFPNSLVAIRGVDQSVLLLKEDKDITESSLKNIEQEFDNQLSQHRTWGGSDSFQLFEDSGLHILTNSLITKNQNYPIRNYGYGGFGFRKLGRGFGMPVPMAMASESVAFDAAPAPSFKMAANNNLMSAGAGAGGGSSEPIIRIRSSFPETWIFMEEETVDGKLIVEKTVPDTITSWIINGFQINPEEGIGLASSSTQLTVFRPFFIVLNLPYSVVKGEIFSLQVMVHNYMENVANAKVTLDNTENTFKFVGDGGPASGSQQISIEPSSVSVLSFLITPIKIGIITLNIKAVTNVAGDALSQPLIIKAPGVKQSQNNAIFLNLLTEHSKTRNISAIFPASRVPDADTLKVTVIGDILGGTINNLDKLIQLPHGCGEQNMVNFVPDIVVLDYLKITESLSEEIKRKAIQFLETGYQQELTYKRYDGSFSAFGNSDNSGSTWLTAFVIRSFISAKRYISIDESVLYLAFQFLNRQQAENGSFVEEGYIHDHALQGGAGGNPYALTAFTLLTFVDAMKWMPKDKLNYSSSIDIGVNWLISQENQINDAYAINLITYLLHVLNHPKKDDFFKLMEDHATTDSKSDFKYWQAHSKKRQDMEIPIFYNHWHWSPWEYRVKPASVEMTSYALLTHLIREGGQVKDSIPIARWLMKQRNSNGGFLSTQDTVVGITALAKFAEVTRTPEYEMKIKVSWGASTSYTFYIGKDNTTTLQEYFLPLSVRNVDVVASGTGTALAQLSWNYYTIKSDNSSGFSLDIKVDAKDKNRRLEMSICSAYTAGEKSNMVILEINTPTGYAFDYEELIKLKTNPQVMRHETEDQDSKLNVYFSYLSASNPLCIKITAHRIYLVAKHSKTSVVIYDYYDTTMRSQKFYDGPQVDVCQICSLDDSCKIKKCV